MALGGGAPLGVGGEGAAVRPTPANVVTSAATLNKSSERWSRLASEAASAARRSHFSDSTTSPRDHSAEAVDNAQLTSSSSSGCGAGIGCCSIDAEWSAMSGLRRKRMSRDGRATPGKFEAVAASQSTGSVGWGKQTPNAQSARSTSGAAQLTCRAQ